MIRISQDLLRKKYLKRTYVNATEDYSNFNLNILKITAATLSFLNNGALVDISVKDGKVIFMIGSEKIDGNAALMENFYEYLSFCMKLGCDIIIFSQDSSSINVNKGITYFLSNFGVQLSIDENRVKCAERISACHDGWKDKFPDVIEIKYTGKLFSLILNPKIESPFKTKLKNLFYYLTSSS